MLIQVDSDGYSLSLMDSIIDHHWDPSQAIPIEDKLKYITTKSRQKHLWKTMKGWKLLIQWKDKSKAWINLADMNEAHLVETAQSMQGQEESQMSQHSPGGFPTP